VTAPPVRAGGAGAVTPTPGPHATGAVGLQVAESFDLIDLIRLVAQPTAELTRIDVGEDGTVSFADAATATIGRHLRARAG